MQLWALTLKLYILKYDESIFEPDMISRFMLSYPKSDQNIHFIRLLKQLMLFNSFLQL